MFRFNFNQLESSSDEAATDCGAENATGRAVTIETQSPALDVFEELSECKEIFVTELHRQRVKEYREHAPPDGPSNEQFHLVDFKHLQEFITDQKNDYKALNSALEKDSDVISGVYEGGLKVWECTMDLLNYLEKENINLEGLEVLDLGCGAGLLGIQGLKSGASSAHFQDYNADVIDLVTIPNVLLNFNPDFCSSKAKYFSGDWASLPDILSSYDVILTAETIYNPANYSKLLRIFEKVLKPNGVIYVAAKQHYFGVGGNLWEFDKLLQQTQKWQTSICFSSDEGVKRQILKVTPLEM